MEIKSFKTWFGFGFMCVGNAALTVMPDNIQFWLGWPLFTIGLSMIFIASYEFIFNKLGWSFSPKFPYPIIMPLDKAGMYALKTQIKSGMRMANALNMDTGDLRPNFMAMQILPYGSLYGTLPGFTFMEEIPSDEYGHIQRDAKTTRFPDGRIIHDNLKIEIKALLVWLWKFKRLK